MSFASLAFVPFFIIVSVVYYLLPGRMRWTFLLLASCYFYMAFVPKYILVLFTLILIDFFMALLLERTTGRTRKICFLISICSNLGMLFVFKYFNFFNANVALLAQFIGWNYSIATLQLLLPLGLSFHTFQSMSYVIEVYRGKYPAERNIGIYALYVLFFPQLIAGPIERPQHLLPQLKRSVSLDWTNVLNGLRLMGWGFVKKLVIADRLAASVDYVYQNLGHLPSESVLIATVFFAFQLYTDFSGYSDIARGAARVLGIDVMRNFENPYFSSSIAEFWRRWHISLSSWFRDYFYYPLVYRRRRATRAWLYVCIVLTFLVTGLWHGAGWTFIIMGLLHGMYLSVGQATKRWRERFASAIGFLQFPRLRHIWQVLVTFCLVSFSWIFFRAPDIATAFAYVYRLFSAWDLSAASLLQDYFLDPFGTLGMSRSDLLISLIAIVCLVSIEHLQQQRRLGAIFSRQPLLVRSSAYASIVLAVAVFGVFTTTQFIYFQF